MSRPGAQPVPYDFRRPNKFNRDHQRALQIAAETFARQFTTMLSTTLRTVCQVQAGSVGQLSYDEFIRVIPNPSYVAVLDLAPLGGSSLFHLPLPMVMSTIDRLLGGPGTASTISRPLTEIEQALMKRLMDRVLHELAYAFESLNGITPRLVLQESNPQFAQIAAATDMVVTIGFDLRIGTETGVAHLVIPFGSIQPVLEEVTSNAQDRNRIIADPDAVEEKLQDLMQDAPVTVSVHFDEITLPSVEIIDLQPGDVLSLHHPVDRPLQVAVGGQDQFHAVAGRRGKRLACVLVDPSGTQRDGS